MQSYVFPAGSADELIDLAVDQLAAYLANPTGDAYVDRLGAPLNDQARAYATAAGVVGLDQSPQFVIRPGSGVVGDEPIIATAQTIYGNDDKPGTPFVRVVVETLGMSEDWAGKTLQPIQFVVDPNVDEFGGLLDDGKVTADAGSLLASAVWSLLSPNKRTYPLLKTWGFTNPTLRAGAAMIDGIEYERPITFACELYFGT